MSQNSDRWDRLYDTLDSIADVNVYIQPVNGTDIRPPFIVVDVQNLENLADTGQGRSVFNGLYVEIVVGVSTKRDKKLVQKSEITECIELFDNMHALIGLQTEGINTNNNDDVIGKNDNIYKISYSGYYNK